MENFWAEQKMFEYVGKFFGRRGEDINENFSVDGGVIRKKLKM
jgi:hypothetical protein